MDEDDLLDYEETRQDPTELSRDKQLNEHYMEAAATKRSAFSMEDSLNASAEMVSSSLSAIKKIRLDEFAADDFLPE